MKSGGPSPQALAALEDDRGGRGAGTETVLLPRLLRYRCLASLALNPPLTPAEDTAFTIPYFNTYFGDTWHMKPTFTLTYGLGWTLEQPPTEATGKQDVLVDASDTAYFTDFLHGAAKARSANRPGLQS